MRTTFAAITALLFASAPASAETTAPPYRFDAQTAAPTLRVPPPVDLRLGALRLKFEHTTLRDVQRAVGKGRIAHRGDAGESTYWLCYEGTANSTRVNLWLLAGEINGPEQTIGAVQIQAAIHGSTPEGHCPSLPQRLQPITLGRAAMLGFTSTAAVSRLGKPSSETTDALTYFYLGKKPGRRDGKAVEFDRSNLLELRLSAGKVVGLVVSQSTTY